MMISGGDRRNAEVYVARLSEEFVAQLPSCRKHRDHVAADDAAICGDVSERPCQVAERHIAEIIGNRGGTKREPGQGRSSSHCRSLPAASIRSAPPKS